MLKQFQHLYIHVPFCATKCEYCAFYSITGAESFVEPYLVKIETDLAENRSKCAPLKSVFFGGGTPTLLGVAELERLFSAIKQNFTLLPDTEISIECNPETLNCEKVEVIAKHATRVSMGLQSFSLQSRRAIGRKGDVDAVYTALELLRQGGLTNIGLDLIYAIPGQRLDEWEQDLRRAAELNTPHISAYSLSIDEGAALVRRCPDEASDDISCDMWELAESVLAEYGFARYEISNYSKPGYDCVHNKNIWYGDTYLGCGPSAVSFDGVNRWEEVPNLNDWLRRSKPEEDVIDRESRAREVFIMGLRTTKGWRREQFLNQTGFDYSAWLERIQLFMDYNFIKLDDSSISLTTEGLAFWNTIAEELV